MLRSLAFITLAVALFAPEPGTAGPASPEGLRRHVTVLASDEFEGRAPGTVGEEKTVRYLAEQFAALGLTPAGSDGSFVQPVPLVGLTSRSRLSFHTPAGRIAPRASTGFVALSRQPVARVDLNASPIVFAGYGIAAAEYGHDDYRDIDLTGQTVLLLAGAPPSLPRNAHAYHTRPQRKTEVAAARGAAACLIIHATGPVGVPFAVLATNQRREHFALATASDDTGAPIAAEGWLTTATTSRLLAATGHDLAALQAAAARPDFRPVALNATLNLTVRNRVRPLHSRNVAAWLPGRDANAARAAETLVYTAHWDHLGRDRTRRGDQIFNGAQDNASGVAVLLELARLFARLRADQRPARSVLFLALTAEEQGLLGARHYLREPLRPLPDTIAVINVDGANVDAPTHDLELIGAGFSTLDALAERVATAAGRRLVPDSRPERRYFYRSDHFAFADAGVPALYVKAGRIPLNPAFSPAELERRREAYWNEHYHQPGDEVTPAWDFAAVAQETDFLFALGRALLDAPDRPTWAPDAPFAPSGNGAR